MNRRVVQSLGDVAVEFGDRGIDAVASVHQSGIGAKTSREIVKRLIAPDRFGEPLATPLLRSLFSELALVVGLKPDAFNVQPCEVARDFGGVNARVEIGQVPFGQAFCLEFDAGFSSVGLAVFGRLAESGSGARDHLVGNLSWSVWLRGEEARAAFKGALIGIGESAPIRDR